MYVSKNFNRSITFSAGPRLAAFMLEQGVWHRFLSVEKKKTLVFTNRQCGVCPGTVCSVCSHSRHVCVEVWVGGVCDPDDAGVSTPPTL